eukprot:scaffold61540_cov65-Phaeocystis_antarctica.AAC.3
MTHTKDQRTQPVLTRLKAPAGCAVDEETPQPSRQCSRNQCPHDSSCPTQETAVDATAPHTTHTEIGILQPNVHCHDVEKAQCTCTLGTSLPSACLSLVCRENQQPRDIHP